MNIAFEYWRKPGPDNDWCAYDYDDPESGPQAYGPTRLAALMNLWDQLVEKLEGV